MLENVVHPAFQILNDNEIHVWSSVLERHVSQFQYLNSLLSEEERNEANKFCFKEHKINFIVRRGLLRILLASYTFIKPDEIQLSKDFYGKRSMVNSSDPFHFNLSFSNNYVVYAVSKNGPLGIDLEYIKRDIDVESFASFVLSKDEQNYFEQHDYTTKKTLLFHYWTLKEAILKALGLGLTLSPKRISLNLNSINEPSLISIDGFSLKDSIKLYKIDSPPDYISYLATMQKLKNIKTHNL